jgi:hypothetical protein
VKYLTNDINKYQAEYQKKNYDRLNVLTAKGTKKKLQAIAKARGTSVNAIVNTLLSDFIVANSSPANPAEDPADSDSPED